MTPSTPLRLPARSVCEDYDLDRHDMPRTLLGILAAGLGAAILTLLAWKIHQPPRVRELRTNQSTGHRRCRHHRRRRQRLRRTRAQTPHPPLHTVLPRSPLPLPRRAGDHHPRHPTISHPPLPRRHQRRPGFPHPIPHLDGLHQPPIRHELHRHALLLPRGMVLDRRPACEPPGHPRLGSVPTLGADLPRHRGQHPRPRLAAHLR